MKFCPALPYLAPCDDQSVAVGIERRRAERLVPRIVNRSYVKSLCQDGRATTLDEQIGTRSSRAKTSCAACHFGPNLTDKPSRNSGVESGRDPGRYAITGLRLTAGQKAAPAAFPPVRNGVVRDGM